MPFQLAAHSTHMLFIMSFAVYLAMHSNLVTAYVIKTQNSPQVPGFHRQHSSSFVSAALPSLPLSSLLTPTSSLASKVIFQSPAMENIYKEILITSKPLSLRKYANAGKIKKSKKESKIYYIPIPAMPYRFIPGVGYDYQPMRINAITQEASVNAATNIADTIQPTAKDQKKQLNGVQKQPQQPAHQQNSSHNIQLNESTNNKMQSVSANSSSNNSAESQLIRLNRGNYYFNGRPIRLQAAHAHAKNHLTSKNLKNKLYFNKNLIY